MPWKSSYGDKNGILTGVAWYFYLAYATGEFYDCCGDETTLRGGYFCEWIPPAEDNQSLVYQVP